MWVNYLHHTKYIRLAGKMKLYTGIIKKYIRLAGKINQSNNQGFIVTML